MPVHARLHRRWYEIANVAEIPSPALLVYLDRVDDNIRDMIAVAGPVERLRPHVKTHKLPEIVRRQRVLGIDKYKCATIAEAEMLAECGCPRRVARLPAGRSEHQPPVAAGGAVPGRRRSRPLVDDEGRGAPRVRRVRRNGPHDRSARRRRLGHAPLGRRSGRHAPRRLYATLASAARRSRRADCTPTTATSATRDVSARSGGLGRGVRARRAARGATRRRPAFPCRASWPAARPRSPMHARRPGVELSPGTCVFWDAGYGSQLPDLPFRPAALVLTRVVSRPGAHRLVPGSRAQGDRVREPAPARRSSSNLPDATAVMHSEEHLVVETPHAGRFAVGDACYGVPWHICPTVALYGEAVVVDRPSRRRPLAGGRARTRARGVTPAPDHALLLLWTAAAVVALILLIAWARLNAFVALTLTSLVRRRRVRHAARIRGARVPGGRRQHARVHRGRHRPRDDGRQDAGGVGRRRRRRRAG